MKIKSRFGCLGFCIRPAIFSSLSRTEIQAQNQLHSPIQGCYTKAVAHVSISVDNSGPDPSAMPDVKSSDKGLLPPRINGTNIRNIISLQQKQR